MGGQGHLRDAPFRSLRSFPFENSKRTRYLPYRYDVVHIQWPSQPFATDAMPAKGGSKTRSATTIHLLYCFCFSFSLFLPLPLRSNAIWFIQGLSTDRSDDDDDDAAFAIVSDRALLLTPLPL